MTAEVLIVVPVLGRPANARPLVESVAETASAEWKLVFVCSLDDAAEIEACEELLSERVYSVVMGDPAGLGDYARKIQTGYAVALTTPYVLLAADDLEFHPGWDTTALAVFAETGCGVVGTNDLANPEVKAGRHSTHPLVSRDYIDSRGGVVGQPGQVYWDGYEHNYVDVELVQTAMARGEYRHCHESRIQHRHPIFDHRVAQDETYRKGRAGFHADRALFESRKRLWLEEVRA